MAANKKASGKEELTNRLKNYNLRARANTSKTVNEVMQGAKKELGLQRKNTVTVIPEIEESMPIVNNDILAERMAVEVEDNSDKDVEMMMATDEMITMKSSPCLTEMSEDVIFNARPQLCEEYIPEIFEHLKQTEFDFLPSSSYMKQQTDINEKMRGILIDWLVEVHLKFKLLPETLFLAVNLIDRYLELKHIMRNRLQLVGVTAMLIACKYEEIYAPEIRDFVYITDKAYTKEEILQMENDMLATLQYNITVPSSFRYLEVYNYFLKMDESSFMFCRYLLELFLVDYKMLKHNPSLLASSTVYITLRITKKENIDKISELTNYSEDTLRDCAKDICLILDNVEKASLQAVKKKFSLTKVLEVAKIKALGAAIGIASIEIQGQRLMLHRNGEYILLEGRRFPRLQSATSEGKLPEALCLLKNF